MSVGVSVMLVSVLGLVRGLALVLGLVLASVLVLGFSVSVSTMPWYWPRNTLDELGFGVRAKVRV